MPHVLWWFNEAGGRTVVLQAAKAAVAAMLAWTVASAVLRLPQPFLAPYAAVFLVESTVYRSLRSALQQVGAVLAGVLLAAGVIGVLPSPAVAMGVVVLVGFVLGRWHRFGSSGVWVGVTALLLVGYGTAGHSVLLVDRLLETVLGSVIGFAVNALVFPPVYGRDPDTSSGALAGELGELLRDMAAALRADGITESSWELVARSRNLETMVRQAEESDDWAVESARLNFRRAATRTAESTARWRLLLAAMRSAWPQVQELAETVHAAAEQPGGHRYPAPATRNRLAGLLTAMAELFVGRARGDDRSRLDRSAEACRTALAELEEELHRTAAEALEPAVGLSRILLPARKAFEAISP